VRTRPVAVVHADDFFTPPEVRHARGRYSPEGFWLDAYDYPRMIAEVLEPPGAEAPGGVLLVEGTFLHRRELRAYRDFSVFLDLPVAAASRRMNARAGVELDDRLLARYVGAQMLYFSTDQPWRRATVVLDSSTPDRLRVIDPERSAAAADARRGG
jgi:uridine kinase